MKIANTLILTAACVAGVSLAQKTETSVSPAAPAAPATEDAPPQPIGGAFAVQPGPLGKAAQKGVKWLLEHQLKNGGWGQGDESRHMGQGMAKLASTANVGDTCVAAMVLLRTEDAPPGSPLAGPHREELKQAIRFVLREIEASDQDSMWVTSVRNTRIQSKIGQYIDTSLASILLGEMLGRMGSAPENARIENALAKVTSKLAKNMKADGSWDNRGWAGGIQSAAATKGYFRAMANATPGSAVASEEVNVAFEANVQNWRAQAGQALSGLGYADSAGIALYGGANQLSSLDEIVRTQRPQADGWRKELKDTTLTEERRSDLTKKVAEFDLTQSQLGKNRDAILSKLSDKRFVSGFGSNGGEEFWSYWNLSEALVRDGGNPWLKWHASMQDNMGRIQNQDGSWSGHHCITGRTFCTSAALLVLLADRTPAARASIQAPSQAADPEPEATDTKPATEKAPEKPVKGDAPKDDPKQAERIAPIKDGRRS